MSKEYDIVNAFQEIEETLISSMKRNLSRHLREEKVQGFNWSMWQAEQLKSLKQFRTEHKDIFKKYQSTIDSDIEEMLKLSNNSGKLKQENTILKHIKNNNFRSYSKKSSAEFFKINEKKLNSLIKATTKDINRAGNTILRYTNDQYRKIIYNAQVYANSGAGTINQAVDMAANDFLSRGISNIQYKNGAIVNITSYVSMAIRTANKRAYLEGEASKRDEWGIHTVYIPPRGAGCPFCVKWQGQALIDDVYSGGTKEEAEKKGYQLLSYAIKNKFLHPNCKDTITTYFEGINTVPQKPTKEELQNKIETYNAQQKQRYNERQIRKYKRLELGSTDSENAIKYHNKRIEWQQYNNAHCKKYGLKRDYDREKVISIEKSVKDDIILTEGEILALNRYISSDSFKINEKLRDDILLDKEDLDFRDNLDSALRKREDYKGNVVRVLQISDEESLKNFLKHNEIGTTTTYNEYLSFSDKPGYNEDANIFIYTNSKKAKDIRAFNPEESEILYPRNSTFFVENIIKKDDKYYILWSDMNE